MANDNDDGYEVGYRKPPKRTQFRPGQSGNPQGRPKGAKNLKADLVEELNQKIVIREGERSRKVTKQRAFVKSMVNGAIKGNARATTSMLSTMLRLLDTGERADEIEEPLVEDELEIMEAFTDSIRRRINDRKAGENEDDEVEGDPS